MDALLARLGAQAFNMAVRSGLALTSTYAIGQCSRLLKTVDDKPTRLELKALQTKLDSKIKILSPVIDLIEFKSGRGNVFLEAAVPLAKSLHRDIVALGKRIEQAALAEEHSRRRGTTARTDQAHHAELLIIIREIKALLARIESDIPDLQLAITASGETLSSSLPTGISPSRFLQASFFLNMGDTQFASDPTRPVQIGPTFYLSLYMLFAGHSTVSHQQGALRHKKPATPGSSQSGTPSKDEPYGLGEGERKPIWQEVLHKARVRLCRTPMGWYFDHALGYVPSVASSVFPQQGAQSAAFRENPAYGRPDEFSYHLEIVEDLEDGRFHEDTYKTSSYDGMSQAGIRESIPIHHVAKIFYTDSGRILNIGNTDEAGNNPILLLKRDIGAPTAEEVVKQIMTPEEAGTDVDVTGSVISDEQDAINRQIREESGVPDVEFEKTDPHPFALHLPPHLDPEWFALEVFHEDEDDDSSDSLDGIEDEWVEERPVPATKASRTCPSPRPLVDVNIVKQMKNLSTTDLTGRSNTSTPSRKLDKPTNQTQRDANFMARSPFGSVTSSLSLMEMLIRLTSLQEFQQAAHLSIPDYILSFFLEETSTTGLKGEARWKARNEAKRRVGFDPYTDSPSK
ncbi:unnamed protein product [Discula destructiva]